ncbi:hypothetical protein BHE74_00032118 [Ensete ventricosum]|nr:hypothetical protein BHE74_00032118 [Ensete ventricosum]
MLADPPREVIAPWPAKHRPKLSYQRGPYRSSTPRSPLGRGKKNTRITTGDTIAPLGITTLLVTIRQESRTKTVMVPFMVVKLLSAYNAIIGRPTLNRLRAAVSTYHNTKKFLTSAGVDKARSDPQESRQCYLAAMTLQCGPALGGDSSLARKAYARTAIPKRPRQECDPEITLRSGEEEYPDHDNEAQPTSYIFDVFQKLGLTDGDLVPMTSTLSGFTGDAIAPLGITTLLVTIGEEPRTKMVLVSFMVVKFPSAYNAIIGRPTLNKLRAAVSMYHRIMKFSTNAIAPLIITTLLVIVVEEPRTKTVMVSFMVVKLPSAHNAIIGRPTIKRLRAAVSTYHRTMKFSTSAEVGEARSDTL